MREIDMRRRLLFGKALGSGPLQIKDLEKGKQKSVRLVPNASALKKLYKQLAKGMKKVDWSGHEIAHQHPEGTKIGVPAVKIGRCNHRDSPQIRVDAKGASEVSEDIGRRDSERPLVVELLIEGLVDYIDPWWIYGTARGDDSERSAESVRLEAWGAVAELLIHGLVTLGDVAEDGRFVERVGSVGDLLVEVFSKWQQSWGDEIPQDRDFCLSNTPLGDETARQALDS